MKQLFLSVLFIGYTFTMTAQTDEFIIGMFGHETKSHIVDGFELPIEEAKDSCGFNTSTMNILKEDGFNIVKIYGPGVWHSEDEYKSFIRQAANNNLKVQVSAGTNFLPSLDENGNYLGYGYNDYQNCNISYPPYYSPYSQGYFKHNILDMFDRIYTQPEFADIIWGYHNCEEASYLHEMHSAPDCQGNNLNDTSIFTLTEIPPDNVQEARELYKSILENHNIFNHKMVIMEASHRGSINRNFNDKDWQDDLSEYGQNQPIDYDPWEYVELLDPSDKRDVFFDGSYYTFETANYWGGWSSCEYSKIARGEKHHLGFLGSIDYARQHASSVHNVLMVYYVKGTTESPYHTDVLIPNANYLWFKAYASIIHGAKGIWFWWLPGIFEFEINELLNITEPEDKRLWHYGDTVPDRFERKYFPRNYRYFIANLAKELNYLSQKGFLAGQHTEILSKTDHADTYGIVPICTNYINQSKIPDEFYSQLNHHRNETPNDHISENYGLRYTIRSNGEETIMIIANCLPVPILGVDLDFGQTEHSNIQNANSVEVLFESDQEVTSQNYKVVTNEQNHRESIDMQGNLVVSYSKPLSYDKKLKLDFGPLDVHIIRFTEASIHSDFLVYPNPAQNSFCIANPGDTNVSITVYGINGTVLKKTSSNQKQIIIDCSTTNSGIYLIQIETSKSTKIVKLIICK